MSDWKSVVSTVAPWIGTALGGPLGGMAVTAVANALGLSDKTEESIKAAISGATPESLLALKQADQAFAVQMQELGLKNQETLAALAVDDRKDARAMQVATRSRMPAALSALVTMGYFGILIGIMAGVLNPLGNELLLGSLSTAWLMTMTFNFGGTASSDMKTDLLARAQPVR